MFKLLVLWLLLIVLFLYHSNNLLLSLLLLEIIGFMVIYFVSFTFSITFLSDFVILFLFAITPSITKVANSNSITNSESKVIENVNETN